MERLKEEGYVNIKFLKNQYTSWAKVDVITEDEDYAYVMLSFNNSMITYCKDRILDIEIILDDEEGLKIPNSALVTMDFYLIPKDYLTKGGRSDNTGFLRETYDEDGNMKKEFIRQLSIPNQTPIIMWILRYLGPVITSISPIRKMTNIPFQRPDP